MEGWHGREEGGGNRGSSAARPTRWVGRETVMMMFFDGSVRLREFGGNKLGDA